jgi:hypothetical protein
MKIFFAFHFYMTQYILPQLPHAFLVNRVFCVAKYSIISKTIIMEELIQRLQNNHGLSADQSHGILNTIATYIKEKFPMVGGAVDSIFHTSTPATPSTVPGVSDTVAPPVQDGGNFLDKISDFIPGATGEKIETFAKDKLGGLFGENKTV